MSIQGEQFPFRDMNPSAGGVILMPYFPLTLSHVKQSISAEGLVDSGSTVSVLPYEAGVKLGFVWEQQTLPVPLIGVLAARPDGRRPARGVPLLRRRAVVKNAFPKRR